MTLHAAIDCRLMFYRKAGIAQYTRHLMRALATHIGQNFKLSALLDARDRDTGWLPSAVKPLRVNTPAHHRLESIIFPVELGMAAARHGITLTHFPDFIAAPGNFRKVITIHDVYFLKHPEVLTADAARYYNGIAASMRRADRVITVSAATRNDVVQLLAPDPAKISVVHSAGDIEPAAAREPERVPPYALFIGTFEPRKNLVTLLRALALTGPEITLTIVGEAGWGADEPSQLAQSLGLAQRVTFAGRVSDAERDRLLAQARVLVLPSLDEGFGLPVLEAMSRGTPVICSNAAALVEIAAAAALYHMPLDADALAGLLTRMWQEPTLRDTLSKQCLQRAAAFSWARTARETLLVYRQVVQ